jgi:hypothetical protein
MMIRLKAVAATLALVFGLLSSAPHAFADNPIYFSFDLDGTLVDTIVDLRQVDSTQNLIRASDGLHLPVWGATALVQSLIDKVPDARIVIDSGGDAERNRELLSKIILKDRKSLLDHTYKVLSKEDLTPVTTGPDAQNLRQSERFKKDLRKIAPGIDLSRVIHIDDIPGYVLPGQEKNVITINPAYSYVDNYARGVEMQRQGMKLKNPPPSRAHWAWDTQRLVWARGLIEEALNLTHRRQDLTLPDAITLLQKSPDQRRFITAGEKAMSSYKIDHSPMVHEIACPELVPALVKGLSK